MNDKVEAQIKTQMQKINRHLDKSFEKLTDNLAKLAKRRGILLFFMIFFTARFKSKILPKHAQALNAYIFGF